MMRLFFIPLGILLSFTCWKIPGYDADRKALIGKAIEAISRGDSVELYSIIDTSFALKSMGRKGFYTRFVTSPKDSKTVDTL
jgi:hypothetical protein